MPIDNDVLGKDIKVIPKDEQNIGVELDDETLFDLINGSAKNPESVNKAEIENFSRVSQSREHVYNLIESMCQDATVSTVLEIYTEYITQTNDEGVCIWADSDDTGIKKVINLLINDLRINQKIDKWVYNLLKYGDLYVKLYRNSEIDSFKERMRQLTQAKEEGKQLNEELYIKLQKTQERYSKFIEMVSNPGEMFELTKFDKTALFIQAPSAIQQNLSYDYNLNPYINYKLNRQDVVINGPKDFVHCSLQSGYDRYVEKVSLFRNTKNADGETELLQDNEYNVVKGQSLLLPSFKKWREVDLLRNSLILNRLTKSALVRIIQIDVGDMPDEKVRSYLTRIKEKIETKSAVNINESIQNYDDTKPIENIIYIPKHGEQGTITQESLGGGDINVRDIADIDLLESELYASWRIPKQFLGKCLRGNTKIKLLNGESVSIEYLFNNKDFYIGKGVMSVGEDGSLEPTTIKDINLTRKNAKFLRITLNNGEYVDVTPDHRMMLRDGSFVEARELNVNDSLMPYVPECNHKVVLIEELDVIEDAYDITVASNNHTFALDCGIFVHNCEDNAGFNGGSSLSIISSDFGRAIKRFKKVIIDFITTILNLYLYDSGKAHFIGKFKVQMTPTITQEDLDRREARTSEIDEAAKIMQDASAYITDDILKLELFKETYGKVLSDTKVSEIIDKQIKLIKSEAGDKDNENNPSQGNENLPPLDFGPKSGLETMPMEGEEPIDFDTGEEEDLFNGPAEDNTEMMNEIPEMPTTEPQGEVTLPTPGELQ